jgi:hypothetical protein
MKCRYQLLLQGRITTHPNATLVTKNSLCQGVMWNRSWIDCELLQESLYMGIASITGHDSRQPGWLDCGKRKHLRVSWWFAGKSVGCTILNTLFVLNPVLQTHQLSQSFLLPLSV